MNSRMPKSQAQGRSLLSRFAAPHTFHPDLSLREALTAIAAVLTRIFGGCFLLALWGGAAGYAWTVIANHALRMLAEILLLLVFLALLAGLMIGVASVEEKITPQR